MSDYLDTSFLVSLYIPDTNSVLAAERMERLRLPVLLTSLNEMELMNALQLRVFRRELQPSQARAAAIGFRTDRNKGSFAMHPLSEEVFVRAVQLAAKWTFRLGTRSLDILHVAAALTLRAEAFHTFDGRQRKLARAVDLVVI